MKKFLQFIYLFLFSFLAELGCAQIITTIAGTGAGNYTGDGGTAAAATFNNVYGVSVDASGNIFIADLGNSCIRKINTSGIITTVAGGTPGSGGDGGPATSASLSLPRVVVSDAAGNLYIADKGNQKIRKVNTSGIISTFAGTGGAGFGGDGGAATSALLNVPTAVASDAAGNIYIADQSNSRIRKVATTGIISTIAGTGVPGYTGDGALATSATLNNPIDLAVDAAGNIYISDYGNNCVRKINTSGIISTIAGTGVGGFFGDGGAATAAKLFQPEGICIFSGNIYITDNNNQRIRKVNSIGIISTVAGTGVSGFSGDLGPATSAQLQNPVGCATDAAGNLYIGDCNNNRIRKVNTVSTATNCPTPISVAAKDSTVFVSNGATTIASGSTWNCMSRPFYVIANQNTSTLDTVNGIYTPAVEIKIINQTSLGTYGEIHQYENGTAVSCGYIGNTSGGGAYAIGTNPTAAVGAWWQNWNTCMPGGIDPTKLHRFVFKNTNTTALTNSWIILKSPRAPVIYYSAAWNLATAGSFTVDVLANTNVGASVFTINPVPSNTLAAQDLRDGSFKINPKLLALGTYTVTYTFSDTLCSGTSKNYIFTIAQPQVNWTAPSSCFPAACINLNPTIISGNQTGGLWSGIGVNASTVTPQFCSSLAGAPGTYTVTYTVGSGTCTNTQSHPVVVNATPTVTVASASVCTGFSAALNAVGAASYTWNPGTGLSATSGANVIASPTTTTSYTVTGTTLSCSANKTVTVTVFPKPVAAYNASPVPALISNPTINFSDQSSGAAISLWRWDFGNGANSLLQNPSYTYANVGIYAIKLVVTSVNGCKDSATGSVEVIADDIKVYNSFSPNGDGLNDRFEIDNIDKFGGNHVYIYNRWGQLLWDKQDYNNTTVVWEGKDGKGNILAPGTYFYIIEVNGKKTEKHWVELTK